MSTTAHKQSPIQMNAEQEAALEAAITEWRTDITAFAEDVFGIKLTAKQQEITNTFRDHEKITIRGGAGFGKTTSMAILLWWSLITYDEVQFSVFGPTESQLKTVFWKEVSKLYEMMPPELAVYFDLTATRASRRHNGASCFAEYKVASKDNPASARGIHTRNNFLIVDEATGVDRELFTDAFMNVLTDPNPKVCLVSNPDKIDSFFYDTFYHETISEGWIKIHGTMRDGPFMTDQKYRELATSYGGATSSKYRIMALGEFPLSDSESLIDRALIDEAVSNKDAPRNPERPIIWGLDPAGKGKDKTVLMSRQGGIARIVREWQGLDAVQLAESVLAEFKATAPQDRPKHLCVDATGLGEGPSYMMQRLGLPVTHVKMANRATRKPHLYVNVRAQLWVETRDWFIEGDVSIPDHPDLIRELTVPLYEEYPKFKIEKKEEIKKRLKRSPDFADALTLTFYHSDNADYDYFGTKALEYSYSSVYE